MTQITLPPTSVAPDRGSLEEEVNLLFVPSHKCYVSGRKGNHSGGDSCAPTTFEAMSY